ncbi:MAG TPA: hypothetical protein LFW20_01160 [Rickettsia endosymbiont of Omalisus fontisbellaquei]|nr:hypothetical protein [Rickettsia endosymbiont of Omalisus fontisbellaquei]
MEKDNYRDNDNYNKCENSKTSVSTRIIVVAIMCLAILYILLPENTFATSIEAYIGNADVVTKKFKTFALSGATILAAIVAVLKGNIKIAGVMVSIGVILGMYLQWVQEGMKVF